MHNLVAVDVFLKMQIYFEVMLKYFNILRR